jgi:hypothetical protein
MNMNIHGKYGAVMEHAMLMDMKHDKASTQCHVMSGLLTDMQQPVCGGE